MIITDSFVMLNYPKTGSTFARKVIKDLYATAPRRWFKRRWHFELLLPDVRHGGEPHQHGCYCQIPKRYLNREVVSIVRNPYDRFLSVFKFRHWAAFPPKPVEVLRQRFPRFPDLTMDEYVDFFDVEYGSAIGPQTFQFMQLFSRQLPSAPKSCPSLNQVLGELGKVTFLHNESLNSDLVAFLQRKGFSAEQTGFILDHKRVNETDGKTNHGEQHWTTKALDYVTNSESLLFDILRELGISYQMPVSMAA